MALGHFIRILRINRVFVRHGLDEFVRAVKLFRPYRLWLHLFPWNWWRGSAPRAQRLREALEELGPIFVKFGQVLSTRPDLLPDDIALELTRLQDRVPPFPGDQAVEVIEKAFKKPLHELFSDFDRTPVASASVAQVHFATLQNGQPVAVKVLRPGIEQVIQRDVDLLFSLARVVQRYSREARRLRPVEVVEEFSRTLHDELDLRREAANASQLRNNFSHSELLYVPEIYWDFTRREVLVMERISGIPISDIDGLNRAGIDLEKLSNNGVEIFFTQAFRDGFFHADMHPGNIFVTEDGQYRAVDFGIMGSLGESDKRYLAENFVAFFNRDYRAVADAHLRAGWVPPDTRAEDFEGAIRAVCEPIFAKPIKDISFGRLLMHLFQTARRYNMEVQPQLVLLQKTLFQIEGLGRRLYPELDLWVTAKPFLEDWMKQQMGPRALLAAVRKELPKWWQIAPELPGLIHHSLKNRQQNVDHLSQQIVELQRRLEAQHRQRLDGFLGSALLVAGVIALGFGFDPFAEHVRLPAPGWWLLFPGVLLLLKGYFSNPSDKA